jgi:DNA helicase-2/ATP-dependent DNA helicase PcrA
VQHVFTRSYAGFYVDEYQDCTVSQHRLLLVLSRLRPCRIVGDPLQGIFGFDRNDPLPDWQKDVVPQFERLPDLVEPHRWLQANGNRPLGAWIADLRSALIGETAKIAIGDGTPVRWVAAGANPVTAQVATCFRVNKACELDTVVAIHNLPNKAHWLAKRLNGCFESMEEVESRDLMKHCGLLDDSSGFERASQVVETACECMVRIPDLLNTIRTALKKGALPKKGKTTSGCPDLLAALELVATGADHNAVGKCLDLIARIPGVVLFRRELLRDLCNACRVHDTASGGNLKQTAWRVRDEVRRHGRRLPRRLVSRTLLVKGLEFDHAVVLDMDGITDAKNLYVALTRGSKSLTVVSSSPVFGMRSTAGGVGGDVSRGRVLNLDTGTADDSNCFRRPNGRDRKR